MNHINPRRLFFASCLALITTAVAFSIRGDILDALTADLHISKQQAGILLGPAFWGNTVAVILGGSLVDFLGMRRLLYVSSLGYVYAVLAILLAPRPAAPVAPFYSDPGFLAVYSGMLALGLCQGLVEGVINPLCTALYPEQKTRRMNVLHAWWPGGLILGGLVAFGITRIMNLDAAGVPASLATLGWRIKLAVILLPAAGFAFLIRGQRFPRTERVAAGVSTRDMFREALRPMFLLWFGCMWLTAATEIGPDQWVGSLITRLAGMQGILILVYTAGIMFVLRFFGGGLARRLSPPGLLTLSAFGSMFGLLALSRISTPLGAFAAATLFGAGKTYFWPVMLGVTAERFPKGGALLLAIIGGAGNLSIAFILPIMGAWYDGEGAAAAFRYVAVLPAILTVVFGALFLYFRGQGGYRSVRLTGLTSQRKLE
ncbi:MAG: MFS transporter [Acidobacteria bacterium]|nr:MFS transporter [Acidobacteriota bacterium]